MKRVLLTMTFLLLFGCTPLGEPPAELAPDLAHYPHWFFDPEGGFNGVIIVDEHAPDEDRETARLLVDDLARYDSSIRELELRTYPQQKLHESNAILVGSCQQTPDNKWANLYLDCVSMMEEQALIRIVDHHGVWLLIIVGYDERRARDAIEMLKDYKSYSLSGPGVEVVRMDDSFRVGLPR